MVHAGGRKTKLTPERADKLVQAIGDGFTYLLACSFAGIHLTTFLGWQRAVENGTGSDAQKDLFVRVRKAEGEGIGVNLRNIKSQSRDDWRASAWLLERRYPQEYGRRVVDNTHSGPDGESAIALDVRMSATSVVLDMSDANMDRLTDEEAVQLRAIAAKLVQRPATQQGIDE